jgi:membrane fusion protein
MICSNSPLQFSRIAKSPRSFSDACHIVRVKLRLEGQAIMTAVESADRVRRGERIPLFRPQVAERHWDMLESRGLRPHPPRHALVTIAILSALFAVGGIFMARGALPKLEFARGYLEPAAGVARVRAQRQGTVVLHVQNGQHVAKGDTLVTLQSGQTTESGAAAEAEIAAQLDGQRKDIEAQLARESLWRESEARRLEATLEEAEQDIASLKRTLQRGQEQLDLQQKHADNIRKLAEDGTISLDELHRRDIAVLADRQSIEASGRELIAKQTQQKTTQIALEQLPTVASERMRSLRDALANVQQRLIELEARRAIVIRTPLSGVVASLSAFVGANLTADSAVATIVPDGSELHAHLMVPARSIAKVRLGQNVSIRYDAFPYQRYGTFKGQVTNIANTMTLPQDADRVLPMKLTEPAYMVDVDIERQHIATAHGRQAALRPDMLLAASVEVDRSSLLSWVGESVFGIAQR